MKKLLTTLTAMSAFALIVPSAINNTHFVVQQLKRTSNYVFEQMHVPGLVNFNNYRSNTYKDTQGNTWLSSDQGLYKYNGVTRVFSQVLGGIPSGQGIIPQFLTQDNSGIYWITVWSDVGSGKTATRSLWFSTDGINFQQAQFTPNGTTKYIFSYKDSSGKLWLLTSEGLYWIQNSTTVFNKVSNGLPADFAPLAFFVNAKGYVYVCDRYHVYSAADGGLNFAINKGIGLPTNMGTDAAGNLSDDSNYLPHFYQDSTGTVYLAVNYGVYKCTDGPNPVYLQNMQVINLALFTQDPWATIFYIDSQNNLWIGTKQVKSDGGSIFVSKDGGTSFTSVYASAGIGQHFVQDSEGVMWAATDLGLYRANVDNTSMTRMIDGNFWNMTQDNTGLIFVLGLDSLYRSLSETFSGTGYSTVGKQVKRVYKGEEYVFANKDVVFFANDIIAQTVKINDETFLVNGGGFSKTLTGATNNGIYNITVTYRDGTVSTYNFLIFDANKNNIASLSTTSSVKKYIAGLKGKDLDYYFCTSASAGANANFNIKLGLPGFDPIVDLSNSYYEQLNPTTFDVIPGTRVALTNDTTINVNGLYLITVTDYLGASFQYCAQLGDVNAKEDLGPISPLIPIGPGTKVIRWMDATTPARKIIHWMDSSTPANKIKIPWMNIAKADKVLVPWKPMTPSTHIQQWNPLKPAIKKLQPSKPVTKSMIIGPSKPYTPPAQPNSNTHIYDNKVFIGFMSCIVGLGAGGALLGTVLTITHFVKKIK